MLEHLKIAIVLHCDLAEGVLIGFATRSYLVRSHEVTGPSTIFVSKVFLKLLVGGKLRIVPSVLSVDIASKFSEA